MKRLLGIIILISALFGGQMAEPVFAQKQQQKTTRTTAKKRSTGSNKQQTSKQKKQNQAKPRTAAEVKQAKQRNAGEIRETKRKIQLNTRETEQRLNQLNLLEGEISDCNTNIGRLSHRVDSINRAITEADDSINALDSRIKAITDKYVKSIRKSQGRKQETGALAFIFSSESFSQAYRRMRALRQFSKWRKRRSVEISDMRNELGKRREALADTRKKAASAISTLNAEKTTLVNKQQETNRLVDRLRKEGGELNQIMSRRQREAEALDAELDRIIAEEAARQERLRREREEAERRARIEAERKAREAEEARLAAEKEAEQKRLAEAEAKAAREAEEKAQAAREAEKKAREKAAEAECRAKESADKAAKEQAKKERQAAKKAEQERIKAEKEAAKKAREAEKQAAREKARKGKPVKHTGKNNGRGEVETPGTPALSTTTPTLKAPVAAGASGVAPAMEVPAGSNFGNCKGRLPFPVEGRYTIVKRFGRQKHPTLPHVETTNSGIDMQTSPGAPVRCVFDGEVSAVFRPDGYNNVVVVRHGEYMTVYANLGSITVSTGQKIKAGQSIGTVYTDANDGNRSILHFEIRHRRAKENPELWLKR